jgi:hypothetical protein
VLKNIYIGLGAFMLAGYGTWSLLGGELGSRRDKVPTERRSSSHSSHGGRSGFGYIGSGGGYGK